MAIHGELTIYRPSLWGGNRPLEDEKPNLADLLLSDSSIEELAIATCEE